MLPNWEFLNSSDVVPVGDDDVAALRVEVPEVWVGPNSIETFWLELWLAKPLEFWLEIPYTLKMLKNG